MKGQSRALCTLLVGDYGQLGGVRLVAPFSPSQLGELLGEKKPYFRERIKVARSGAKAFSPSACIILDENWRQRAAPRLAEALNRLYWGEQTDEDYEWFMDTCSKDAHAQAHQGDYDKYLGGRKVVRLYRTNADCTKYNTAREMELAGKADMPVAYIKARNELVNTTVRKKSYVKLKQKQIEDVKKQHGAQLAGLLCIAPGMEVMR